MTEIYKIYKYTFPDGKVYIGQTKLTLEQRRDNGYQHNKALQSEIRKYGWNGFKHEILFDNLTREEADKREIETIKKYDSTNPSKGYNISHGGRCTYAGLKHTKEYREKMSRLYKGKQFSEITKQRLQAAQKKKPVICLKDGVVIAKYISICSAAKSIDGYATNIMRVCKGEAKTYKGYEWMYEKGR